MNILAALRAAFAAATPAGGDPAEFAAAVRVGTDPRFGDYQANGCMGLAKRLGVNPRALAEEVAQRVDLGPLADAPEVAGPGFLNVRLRDDWLARTLGELLQDDRLGLDPPEHPRTVVIDYSSPNVAKPMHVGHIRTTVIGESLARVFTALGHRVIRDNHLGDWGTQFGMILWGWKQADVTADFARDPVGTLAQLYQQAQARIKAGETLEPNHRKVRDLEVQGKAAEAEALFRKLFPGTDRETVERTIADAQAVTEAARAETARLHAGDPEARALWNAFMPPCLAALQELYDRLDVHFDVQLGESFYDPMLNDLVRSLTEAGIAVESEGATVVFVEGTKAPLMVRKRDGAFTYATTDLATLRYRQQTWNPDQVLYVVDHRQSDHFKQVFEVARRTGLDGVDLVHVGFGTILGADRRPFRTRSGDVIGLESLLDEAVERARRVVDENSPELEESQRQRVAEIVGLGAIKYADLSQNRLSDYVFDWDKMMAMNGNSGVYMQYAYARTQSIFRRGGLRPEDLRAERPEVVLEHPAERALGLQLLRFSETLELAAAELKPNIVTEYLFDLATKFSVFFENCPVLKAETDRLRSSRLAVTDLTGRTLKTGLGLLGIEVAERL